MMEPFEYKSLKDAQIILEEATNLTAFIEWNSTLRDLTIQEDYHLSLLRSFIDTKVVQSSLHTYEWNEGGHTFHNFNTNPSMLRV